MRMFFSRSSRTICAIVILSILILGTRGKRVKRVAEGVPAKSPHNKYTIGIFAGRSPEHEGVWLCGGAIISDHYALTGAVCLAEFTPEELSVVADAGIKEFGNSSSYVYAAKEFIKHPDYKPTCSNCTKLVAENNIGLILLEKSMSSVLLNELSQQLYLPYFQVQIHERCSLVGVKMRKALKMYEIEQSLVDLAICGVPGNAESESQHVSRYVCAQNGFADACMNDIGSPLVHNGYIVGVVSTATCEPGGSTIYSNVYFYSYWIFSHISPKLELSSGETTTASTGTTK